jgi:hypothetical protein
LIISYVTGKIVSSGGLESLTCVDTEADEQLHTGLIQGRRASTSSSGMS